MTHINTTNYIHDLVNSYMYITKPCLITGAGGIIFGSSGAVTGLSAYIIDQTLAYFNITNENYLTTIFIGVLNFNKWVSRAFMNIVTFWKIKVFKGENLLASSWEKNLLLFSWIKQTEASLK